MTPTPPPTWRHRSALAAPLVLALLVAGWLLWARQDLSRQGGYCANATVAVARVLEGTVDAGAGATPPVSAILAGVDDVEVERFMVETPPAVAADVRRLDRDRNPTAFARVLVDYVERCGDLQAASDP